MAKHLGKYEIIRSLGQGAMGEVFLAHHPVIGREVAIKTILPTAAKGEDAEGRFRREAAAAGQLSHPNLVTVFDFDKDGEILYLVMEFVKGDDLEDLIKQQALSQSQFLEVLAQVCDGLSHAHRNGVIHRDIKPANVRVIRDGKNLLTKVMDFGIARVEDSNMTATGIVMGTVNYMAPEYIRNGHATNQSDLFAVGVMLYECLTGRKPFAGDNTTTVLFKIVSDPPVPLAVAEIRGISPSISMVLDRALAKEPADRFQNADELGRALRACKDPSWIGTLEQATAMIARHQQALAQANPDGTQLLVAPGASAPTSVQQASGTGASAAASPAAAAAASPAAPVAASSAAAAAASPATSAVSPPVDPAATSVVASLTPSGAAPPVHSTVSPIVPSAAAPAAGTAVFSAAPSSASASSAQSGGQTGVPAASRRTGLYAAAGFAALALAAGGYLALRPRGATAANPGAEAVQAGSGQTTGNPPPGGGAAIAAGAPSTTGGAPPSTVAGATTGSVSPTAGPSAAGSHPAPPQPLTPAASQEAAKQPVSAPAKPMAAVPEPVKPAQASAPTPTPAPAPEPAKPAESRAVQIARLIDSNPRQAVGLLQPIVQANPRDPEMQASLLAAQYFSGNAFDFERVLTRALASGVSVKAMLPNPAFHKALAREMSLRKSKQGGLLPDEVMDRIQAGL